MCKEEACCARSSNERRMPASRVLSVSIWIFAIACAETAKNVETINVEENRDVSQNTAPRLWKRSDEAGIFNEHIKRWNYFKDARKIWLWPKGVVPYVVGTGFTIPEKQAISESMDQFRLNTCVGFSPRRTERDYVEFRKSEDSCRALIGRLKGRNLVELDSGCLKRRTDLMHQLMHVLGFYDQHNTPDRDKWIMIGWDNIEPGKKTYFDVAKARTLRAQQPYDFNSLMHLSAHAFAKDPYHHTMWPLLRVDQIGPLSDKFNSQDIYKINKLYGAECKLRLAVENEASRRMTNGRDDSDEKPGDNGTKTHDGEDDEPNWNRMENNSEDKQSREDQPTPRMICVLWARAPDKLAKRKRDVLTDLGKLLVEQSRKCQNLS